MIRAALPLILLALAACSDRSGTDGSEADFAARVGAGNVPAATAAAAQTAVSTAVQGPPPAGANVFAVEQLGNIGGVDLGPRAGGCTFAANGAETLVAVGPADRALPGKAVVRIGGQLLRLDAPPGGVEAIRAGTQFAGEGFSVRVQPTAPGKANMTIIDSAGAQQTTAGDWVCA